MQDELSQRRCAKERREIERLRDELHSIDHICKTQPMDCYWIVAGIVEKALMVSYWQVPPED